MSATASPVDLPHRTSTLGSSFTRQTSMSDDEAIPDSDGNQVCYVPVVYLGGEERKGISLWKTLS